MTNENSYFTHLWMCMKKIYPKLNDRQLKAVTTVNGPLLVLAGAGSGKTTVLVNRISHIINYGNICEAENQVEDEEIKVEAMKYALTSSNDDLQLCMKAMAVSPTPPSRILCITFTNKAAGEFKERLSNMLGESVANQIWAGTFHSICVRILRKNIGLIGFSNSFTIYDTDDSKKLIAQIFKDFNIEEKTLPIKSVMSAISSYKESRILPLEVEINPHDPRGKIIGDIYSEYQKRLKDASALDFDDIILNTLILFEEHPEVLDFYSEKFKYILVDEYQDTNPSQNDLVIMLGKKHHNVCVVGDDDQSIYSFRGATVENILNFDRSFPEAVTIKLEQNYRSTKTILDAANAVIANNKSRKGKQLWTNGDDGEKIVSKCLYTQNEESDYICSEIMKLHAFGTSLKDIAVLYRMNAISNSIETALVKNRVPYRIFGGIKFLERKEIKDIIAYLSVISNQADNIRLMRIINVPKRSIGDTTTDKITELAERDGVSCFEVIRRSGHYPELQKAFSKLEPFCKMINDLCDYAKTHKISELIHEVIIRTGYDVMLIEAEEKDKLDIVNEFASTGVLYEESAEEPTLAGFLEEVSLVSDTDSYNENEEAVSLMTVHSAKGLEFPIVFIPGFEEGIFPSSMAVQEGNTEEERRLAYVAITRAKKKLYITYTQSRTLYGYTTPSMRSEFYDEIPPELISAERKSSYSNASGVKTYGYTEQRTKQTESKTYEPFKIKKAEPPKAEAQTIFKPGDRVSHKFFGSGTVLSYEQMGNDALIKVSFDNGQEKQLMASFAKLQIMKE